MAFAPVLVHGFTGSSASWGSPVVDGLAKAGLAPVAIDLPGHGRYIGETVPSAFTLEAALACIASAVRAPAPLIGYSMGGRLALHYALKYPQRVTRLVLESCSAGLATEEERSSRRDTDAALADRIVRLGVEAFIDDWEALPLFASQAELSTDARATIRELRLRNAPISLSASLRGLGPGSLPSLWERLTDITLPTLVLVGELDEKFAEVGERMAAAMPNARLVVIPSAGHAIHVEQPKAWCRAVTSFLGPAGD